jgi:HK97 family phage major capsid protein
MHGNDGGYETRAQSKGTNAAGGFLVPQDFSDQVAEIAIGQSAIAQLATQVDTDDGETLPFPLVSALGSAVVVAESGTLKEIVAEDLEQDSGVPFDALLARCLGKRLGVLQGGLLATGSGSGQPQGLATTGAGYGIVNAAAGSATKYVRADLLGVYKALPAAYRPTASWVMHPDDLAELLATSNAAGDAPAFPTLHQERPTLFTRPVFIDPYLPTPANLAHSLAFGDIGLGYAVRRVRGLGLVRLSELHSDQGQVGFRVFERIDGRPLLTDAVRLLRHTT